MLLNKIISSVPFNPSLVEQLAFYAKRLHKEESLRRLGFVMIALSFLVQIFAASVPAEKSLAASNNDIIKGGASSKSEILRQWDSRSSDVSKIYSKFGLSRRDIASLPSKPNVSIRSTAGNYWSIGRHSLGKYGINAQELAINTDGPTVYLRPLKAWGDVSYKAFQGRNSTTGKPFWIIANCGNYVQFGPGTPPPPKLEVTKTITGRQNKIERGEKINFRIQYRNKAKNSMAENVKLYDHLQLNKFDLLSPGNAKVGKDSTLEKNLGNLSYTDNSQIFDITVRAKKDLKNGTEICNSVKLTADNATTVSSGGNQACSEVLVVKPDVECKLTLADVNIGTGVVKFNTFTKANHRKRVDITSYDYNFGDGHQHNFRSHKFTDVRSHTYAKGQYTAQVKVNYYVNGDKGNSKSDKCRASINTTTTIDVPPGLSKKVKNITQNLSGKKALNSTVHAGDVIEYSLVTYNSRESNINNYVISDYIGDILDYADIDLGYLSSHGGSFDNKTNSVIWANQTLLAGTDNVRTFRVKMKSPLPSTNKPNSQSTDYDCKIANLYGNEISMNVQCPVIKNIESLPNTGPGSAIFGAFIFTTVSGYFFARSNLLGREMFILRRNYVSAGRVK